MMWSKTFLAEQILCQMCMDIKSLKARGEQYGKICKLTRDEDILAALKFGDENHKGCILLVYCFQNYYSYHF